MAGPETEVDYDFSGVTGENPGVSLGEVIHLNDRVRGIADISVQRGRFGKLRTSIERYTENGLSVGLQFAGPRRVRMIISEHPDLIKRTAAVAGIAGATIAAGVIYMHEVHHKNNQK